VQAILSAEDKRFFEHPGFDFIRIFGAAWADVRHSQHLQGASTITMQVARTFFLSTDRTWRRKLAEAMLSFELEQRFTKRQIFELYANEVYLGNRGSFGVRWLPKRSAAVDPAGVHLPGGTHSRSQLLLRLRPPSGTRGSGARPRAHPDARK
jgi:penicillin-binding protein 1B